MENSNNNADGLVLCCHFAWSLVCQTGC